MDIWGSHRSQDFWLSSHDALWEPPESAGGEREAQAWTPLKEKAFFSGFSEAHRKTGFYLPKLCMSPSRGLRVRGSSGVDVGTAHSNL
jgi:hypothetical protein